MSNYSNLGFTYKHPHYSYGSMEAKCFLAGAYNFQTIETALIKLEMCSKSIEASSQEVKIVSSTIKN